jgi:outer membrane receptor for ferrienterochelin and colicins
VGSVLDFYMLLVVHQNLSKKYSIKDYFVRFSFFVINCQRNTIMKSFVYILLILSIFTNSIIFSQTDANIFGDVKHDGEHIANVTIYVKGTRKGTVTDKTGHYMLVNLPVGTHIIQARMMGYETVEKEIIIEQGQTIELNFTMEESSIDLEGIVITGTKTPKRISDSPVIVTVLDNATLESVNATDLSDGLNYQPGIRVETDCQTCNYTQLRMNGLPGAYSQILINGKNLMSPLTGLYGLEMMPIGMVDRIEVVRGGASALYGTSAIGGTVNIFTKIPGDNSFSITSDNSSIDGKVMEKSISSDLSFVSESRNMGATFYGVIRDRDAYDNNGDGFSEMPKINNNSLGASLFFKPNFENKFELNLSSINEYRRGGDMIDSPAHEAQQSEERNHSIISGSLDYTYYFSEFRSILSVYFGGQHTSRKHYTGITPNIVNGDSTAYIDHFLNPPYGLTENTTIQSGIQLSHLHPEFWLGPIEAIAAIEYNYDDVDDEIKAYDYFIDQQTTNIGIVLQADWIILDALNLLAGFRLDKHNLLDDIMLTPRFSILYDVTNSSQLRMTYSQGFRAPQAFDADMHIAFSGGGIKLIRLANDLKEEHSQSLSGSYSFDLATEKYIYGFTLESFYTGLKDAFVLEEIEEDEQGNSVMEKRNGGNSDVYGITLEMRGNYDNFIMLDAGLTYQKSVYQEPVKWSEELPGTKEFLRTPDMYGFFNLAYYSQSSINASISSVITGPMFIPHYGVPNDPGTPENDILKESGTYFDLNFKIGYIFNVEGISTDIEIYTGVKNLLNQYQDDFDKGKYRDSGYIYGPSSPRTIYLGIKLFNI